MSREVLAVDAESSIIDLAQKMGKLKPKSYPVTEDGKLVGLITRSAILASLWANRASCDIPNDKQ
jgi:CBS domain-containing protein